MMDYQEILAALQDKARDDISRWRSYKAKHPRKGKDKPQPIFYQSLSAQLNKWLNDDNTSKIRPKFAAPFTERQARYVDKVAPGAYDMIMASRRASGEYDNHHSKCPVRLNLNGLGLEIGDDGIVTCQGCNAVLGRIAELKIA